MPLVISFNGSDIKVIESIQFKQNRVIEALVDKMELLMVRLQEKIRSKTSGRVAEAVRDPEAHEEGGRIVGTLKAGGDPTTVSYKGGKPFDITQILESGAKLHAINPLGVGGQLGGVRQHVTGGKKRLGANVLMWEGAKGKMFAAYVFHPGIPGSHFIAESVNEMRKEIREGLQSALNQVVTESKR